MTVINESEMQFGDYSEADLFRIEKSDFYKQRCLPKGVKTCEFILFRRNTVYFVEAKKTSPNQINGATSKERKTNLEQYIEDIVNKMRDSLSMYTSILLKCHDINMLPQNLQVADFSKINLCFLLVIKDIQDSELPPLKEKFDKEFRRDFQIWNNLHFFIFNEQRAIKNNLVNNSTNNPVNR